MTNVSNDFSKNGASYLISNDNYNDFIRDRDDIGRPDGQFCIPSNQMDEMLQNYPDDPRAWEQQLGLNSGSLGDNDIKRVDVNEPQNYNLRPPSEEMSGVNDQYLGTGKVPGGQDEAVIDQFPNPENHQEVGNITNLCPTNGESTSQGNNETQYQDSAPNKGTVEPGNGSTNEIQPERATHSATKNLTPSTEFDNSDAPSHPTKSSENDQANAPVQNTDVPPKDISKDKDYYSGYGY